MALVLAAAAIEHGIRVVVKHSRIRMRKWEMTQTIPVAALDHVVVDRYTDIVGPSNEMLGPVRDGE
jgi:hypothetical protein